MRVLLIANFGERIGGGEESFLTLARALDRSVVTPYALVPSEGAVADALRDLDIPTDMLSFPPVRPWNAAAAFVALRRLRSRLASWKIDLVHAHGSRGALYAGLVGARLGIPLVWHVRVADRDFLLDGALFRLSARVIAISHAVRRRFERARCASKVCVVYNGVDVEYWKPAVPIAQSAGRALVLVAGRFVPEKGHDTIVLAAPIVLRQCPDARFLLLGADQGRYTHRLRRLVDQIGIAAAVEIRSWQDDPRLVFQGADVIALPSRWDEPFGRVLIEAASVGKPVVATRVGGVPEVVIDGETGLLVPPDNPAALAHALIRLLDDSCLRSRLGTAARQRVLACFTADRHAAGVQAVYADVLECRHRRDMSVSAPSGQSSSAEGHRR